MMEAEFNNASVAKRTRAGFDRYLVAKLYGESGSRNRRKIRRRIPDVELVTDEVEVVSSESDALPVRVEGCSTARKKGRGKKSKRASKKRGKECAVVDVPNFVLVSSPSVHSDEDCWFVEQEEVSKLRDKCGLEDKCIRKGKEKILVYPSNLSILQDDLLEQILVYLPIASIIRAGLVCKKWRKITTSKRFLWNASQTVQQKPWYFMYVDSLFTRTSSSSTWCAYDSILQKCHVGDFLDMMKSHVSFDSSDGLVCFVKDNEIHVFNPITKEHKKLHEPPPRTCLYYHRRLINIWVNRRLENYNVSVLDYEVDAHWNRKFSFQVYDSSTMKWATSQPEILIGWRSDSKTSVICNGVLYFLIYSTGTGVGPIKYGLLAYNFPSNSSTHGTLINSFIPLPCSMIFGLMNLKEKLIIVGAIDKPGVENMHIGFGIWLLKGKNWQEISRITRPCFYISYGNFDSSGATGADDLIYIHNKEDPELVVFDMNQKQWICCQDCPLEYVTTGFCFQPRLDISP